MLVTVCFLLCVISVPLAGGRLNALATFRLRHAWLVFAAIGLQIGIISLFPGSGSAYVWTHLVSYGLVLAFLAANRNLPGLWVITSGTLMNFVAIATNDGVMPATMGALRAAGKQIDPGQFANSAPLIDANYAFLGDVFAIPAGFPLANVFSAGDVCIVFGALVTLHQVCGTRFFPPRPTLTPLQQLDGRT
ncbi:MAG: DUF5317 domain-containing protein [Actinomycetota bacterium]